MLWSVLGLEYQAGPGHLSYLCTFPSAAATFTPCCEWLWGCAFSLPQLPSSLGHPLCDPGAGVLSGMGHFPHLCTFPITTTTFTAPNDSGAGLPGRDGCPSHLHTSHCCVPSLSMELLWISFYFHWRIQPHHHPQAYGSVGLPDVFCDVCMSSIGL